MAALPETNISTTLVGNTIGEASRSVSALCLSSSINRFSRYKPVDGDWPIPLGDNSYGITFPSYIWGTSQQWGYTRPSGGASSPYRLGDFRKYLHEADLPIGIEASAIPETINIRTGDAVMPTEVTDSGDFMLSLADINKDTWQLGIELESSEGSRIRWTGDGSGVALPLNDMVFFPTNNPLFDNVIWKGVRDYQFFLSTIPLSIDNQVQASTKIALHTGVVNGITYIDKGTSTIVYEAVDLVFEGTVDSVKGDVLAGTTGFVLGTFADDLQTSGDVTLKVTVTADYDGVSLDNLGLLLDPIFRGESYEIPTIGTSGYVYDSNNQNVVAEFVANIAPTTYYIRIPDALNRLFDGTVFTPNSSDQAAFNISLETAGNNSVDIGLVFASVDGDYDL